MLYRLHVANFALIEDLSFEFSPRLNVLSGETGAGKSIVIGAISLLLGERADLEQIRQGQESALVEATFLFAAAALPEVAELLDQAGLPREEELLISREISRSGRGAARVNGRVVPVSFLKELGHYLVDLHGQHQHQSLLRPEEHLELLDSYAGEYVGERRREVASLYARLIKMKQELASLGYNTVERERRIDLLSFQAKEIRAGSLSSDEERTLLQREQLLAHAEKLYALISGSYAELFLGDERSDLMPVLDRLSSADHAIEQAARIDPGLGQVAGIFAGIVTQIQELSHELRSYLDNLVFDPQELSLVQARLGQLSDLKRKYGATIEEVLEFAGRAEAELERLLNSEALARQLEREIERLQEQLRFACLELRKSRREISCSLEHSLRESLVDLAMPAAHFSVVISEREVFSACGLDRVEFMFSANPGEDLKPLAKIISGGEISRVMLALKSILARQDRVLTLIFDEVDAGIGGVTIQAVAEKLAFLAVHHQVICVTHSPQIAAMADGHFMLYKELVDGRTLTKVSHLDRGGQRAEIARMLDGAGINEINFQHVDQMLERALRFKEGVKP